MGAVRFSAVVLAAGASTRMAGRHKLLLPLGGEPVIRRTVRAVLGANPQEAVVVTGSNADAVANALAGLGAKVLFNARHAEGQMTSVAAGVAALAARCDAVMVCLGDMALLESADYAELADAFAAQSRSAILVPWRDGIRGNPVVFASSFMPEVLAGNRNLGCRKLIADHPGEVHAYEPDHDRFFVDLDTPEDYARLRERLGLPAERAAGVS
jgi:molybdenum cofactor cytidylyltransferase